MSKILVTGDVHGENSLFNRFSSDNLKTILTEEDYIIVAGDFGLIWQNQPDSQELYNIKWLSDKPWTTLFVDGNHENFYRLNKLERIDMFGSKVGVVSDKIYHLRRGNIYNIYGKDFFCFGGAHSTDRKYRTLGRTWWQEEVASTEEMNYGIANLEKNKNEVDYIITHTTPKDLFSCFNFYEFGVKDPTCSYLNHIKQTIKFKTWYFGHMHVDKMIDKYCGLYENILNIF